MTTQLVVVDGSVMRVNIIGAVDMEQQQEGRGSRLRTEEMRAVGT